MRHFYFLILLAVLIPAIALGQSFVCNQCHVPNDCDNDGYTTDGTGLGLDCDDTDPQVVENTPIWTGTQYRICSAGTFLPESQVHSGDVYRVDCSAATNGTGSISSPFNTLGCIDQGLPCPGTAVTLQPGDQVYVGGGCSGDVVLSDTNQSGTASDRIFIYGDPRNSGPDFITDSISFGASTGGAAPDYITLQNMEITNADLTTIALNGTKTVAGDNPNYINIIANNFSNSTNPTSSNDANRGFVRQNEHIVGTKILHNIFDDAYTTGLLANQNVAAIMVFRPQVIEIGYNDITMPTSFAASQSGSSSKGIWIKHAHELTGCGGGGTNSSTPSCVSGIGGSRIHNNYIHQVPNPLISSQHNMEIDHNYLTVNGNGFDLGPNGGVGYSHDMNVHHNTLLNSECLILDHRDTYVYDGLNNKTYEDFFFRNNVCRESGGDYNPDSALVSITRYGDDALFDAVSADLDDNAFSNNCYYDQIATNATTLFGYFQDSGNGPAGANCTLAEWQSSDPNCGGTQGSGSLFENPALDSCGCTSPTTTCGGLSSGYCVTSQVSSNLTLTISAPDASAGENNGGTPDDGIFRLTLSGPATQTFSVTLSVTGSATNGVDFVTIPTTVNFLSGATTVNLPVDVIEDAIDEGSFESVVLTIISETGANVDVGTPNFASMQILDDDTGTTTTTTTLPSGGGGNSAPWTIYNVYRRYCDGYGWYCSR